MTTTTLTPAQPITALLTATIQTLPELLPASVDTVSTLVMPATITKGWHADPMAIHKLRWHDGDEWTEHVTHFGPVPCQHCGG